MLEEILLSINNRFEIKGAGLSGNFEISSGTVNIPSLKPGQYFWIDGSIFNDGLHKYPATGLMDETFTGTISPAAIPKAVEALASEISLWVEKHPVTDLTSESFGGYSYSRASGKDGAPISWADAFRPQLNRWRKL